MKRRRAAVILAGTALAIMLASAVGVWIASAYRAREIGEPLIWVMVASAAVLTIVGHYLHTGAAADRHG